jgi:hypothetical protein
LSGSIKNLTKLYIRMKKILTVALKNIFPLFILIFLIGNFSIAYAETPAFTAEGSTSTTTISTSSSTPQSLGVATITIRNGSDIFWTGQTSFPIGTTTREVGSTNSTTTVPVREQSLLGALLKAQETTGGFVLSNIKYYAGFNAFLINCVISSAAATTTPACYNWQYRVNGAYPYDSIDQYLLSDGDSVYLYFGNKRQVDVATSSVTTGDLVKTTAYAYDPATNTKVPLPRYTVGITIPDPNNQYSRIEVATSTTDAEGLALFTAPAAGAYGVGLEDDYYGVLTTLNVIGTTTSTPTGGGIVGGGPGTGSGSIERAFTHLIAQQQQNGAFQNTLVTDWGALALSLPDAPASARAKLAEYLRTANVPLTLTTDYERHALALMSLGINPYTGSPKDVITPVVNSFNGTQLGDTSLDSDDIFALIVLPKAGYTQNDLIIQKLISFVQSKQNPNGSWDGGVDLTAAAVQALAGFSGTEAAITKAQQYLKSVQSSDASFSNSDSTSWVLGAIAALGLTPSAYTIQGKTPLTALMSLQQTDGGIQNPGNTDTTSRTWSTAYALTALEGRSWASLLTMFSKPQVNTTGGSGNGYTATNATTTIASLLANATTLPVLLTTDSVATSSVVVAPFRKIQTGMGSKIKVTKEIQKKEVSKNLVASPEVAVPKSFWSSLLSPFVTAGKYVLQMFGR